MKTTWYVEINPEVELSQGDIFLNAPVFTVKPSIEYSADEPLWKIKGVDTQIESANYVVLNQACDLENKPPENVIVAELVDAFIGELAPEITSRKGFLKEIHSGKRPRYTIIGDYVSEDGSLSLNYQIVDLSSIFTIPYSLLDEFKKHYGKRLRLNTPHRELLNQQFGNFYARIGLPNQDFIPLGILESKLKETQQ
ncbi:hypothetical protein J1907_17710 [Lysinibacillus sphaericus]|uniref:hypothetical protein n=1 Tax=Lysinibacillus sphaericus TaxID=1421 RepID=UPI000559D931|nr:hypothetical protein [Lysinibacillus sphaericus]QTB21562.1 hypothetical protein J1907_17710 [Lysinibacillus sphaericus]